MNVNKSIFRSTLTSIGSVRRALRRIKDSTDGALQVLEWIENDVKTLQEEERNERFDIGPTSTASIPGPGETGEDERLASFCEHLRDARRDDPGDLGGAEGSEEGAIE